MTPQQLERLRAARTGHLATCSRDGRPHSVPVCFIWNGQELVIPLDEKPKTVPARRLRRVRNLKENPQACLVIDHYEEAWERLWFVMVEGAGRVEALTSEEVRLLREKYPQYRTMQLEEAIRLQPARTVGWEAQ